MLFCPTCANMLIISIDHGNQNHWICQSCPYMFPIDKQISNRTRMPRKAVDDVLGGIEFGADETEVDCPKCGHDRANYRLLQIRSADEPMTRFYKCKSRACGHVWKED